jgi:hypothetical protein
LNLDGNKVNPQENSATENQESHKLKEPSMNRVNHRGMPQQLGQQSSSADHMWTIVEDFQSSNIEKENVAHGPASIFDPDFVIKYSNKRPFVVIETDKSLPNPKKPKYF